MSSAELDVFVGFDCPGIEFVRIALQSVLALGLLLSHPSWMLAASILVAGL